MCVYTSVCDLPLCVFVSVGLCACVCMCWCLCGCVFILSSLKSPGSHASQGPLGASSSCLKPKTNWGSCSPSPQTPRLINQWEELYPLSPFLSTVALGSRGPALRRRVAFPCASASWSQGTRPPRKQKPSCHMVSERLGAIRGRGTNEKQPCRLAGEKRGGGGQSSHVTPPTHPLGSATDLWCSFFLPKPVWPFQSFQVA